MCAAHCHAACGWMNAAQWRRTVHWSVQVQQQIKQVFLRLPKCEIQVRPPLALSHPPAYARKRQARAPRRLFGRTRSRLHARRNIVRCMGYNCMRWCMPRNRARPRVRPDIHSALQNADDSRFEYFVQQVRGPPAAPHSAIITRCRARPRTLRCAARRSSDQRCGGVRFGTTRPLGLKPQTGSVASATRCGCSGGAWLGGADLPTHPRYNANAHDDIHPALL
jgi:hypothetical protein